MRTPSWMHVIWQIVVSDIHIDIHNKGVVLCDDTCPLCHETVVTEVFCSESRGNICAASAAEEAQRSKQNCNHQGVLHVNLLLAKVGAVAELHDFIVFRNFARGKR